MNLYIVQNEARRLRAGAIAIADLEEQYFYGGNREENRFIGAPKILLIILGAPILFLLTI